MPRTQPWKVSDRLWEQVEPLIPQAPSHAKGGQPRMSSRQACEAIIYVLRTGIQWNALPRELGASSTVHDRFQEWEKAGFFKALWQAELASYDEVQGIQWEWQAVDGAMTKAPFAGTATGANPTDRGKKGVKRSLLTDGAGIPLALASEGANRHDMRTALCDVGWHGHRLRLRQPRRNRSTCVWMLDMIPQLSVSKSKFMTLFLTFAGVGKNSRRKLPRRAFGLGDGWWNARIPGSIGLVVFWCALEKKVEKYLAFLHLACAQLIFAKVFRGKEVCLPSVIAPGRRNSSLSK